MDTTRGVESVHRGVPFFAVEPHTNHPPARFVLCTEAENCKQSDSLPSEDE